MSRLLKPVLGAAAVAATLAAAGAVPASAQQIHRPFCRPHNVTVRHCFHHRIWIYTYRVHFNCTRTLLSRRATWLRCFGPY